MNFLHIESPVMKKLGVMADLLILNLVTLVCCLPIVTAGAAFTAMHYVLLKIVRGEEGYVIKTFFRAFRENFLQGTILWIIMAAVYAALFVDWRILRMQGDEFPVFMNVLLLAAVLIIYMISLYVFPILSRYQNTVPGTIKAALTMSVVGTIRTLGSAVVYPIPYVILFFAGYPIVPIILCFCFTGPGFFRAKMYDGLFRTYETVAAGAAGETKEIDMSDADAAEDASDEVSSESGSSEFDSNGPETGLLPDSGDSGSEDA
ncbi:MAG: YesL family protein [Lachnospiraceae bacterium]|nr:YesL family protein [Lachnospiraceae bacterium]